MYPKPKRNALSWMTGIFVGVSVVVLIAAIAFGILITRDGGSGFRNLMSGDSGNSLSIRK